MIQALALPQGEANREPHPSSLSSTFSPRLHAAQRGSIHSRCVARLRDGGADSSRRSKRYKHGDSRDYAFLARTEHGVNQRVSRKNDAAEVAGEHGDRTKNTRLGLFHTTKHAPSRPMFIRSSFNAFYLGSFLRFLAPISGLQ